MSLLARSKTVAFTDATGIVLWNIAEQRPDAVLRNGRQPMNIAYGSDGSLIVANANDARDKSLILWNTRTGERLLTLNNLPARSETFAFSPDGRTLAAGSEDGTITFWALPVSIN